MVQEAKGRGRSSEVACLTNTLQAISSARKNKNPTTISLKEWGDASSKSYSH